ncbi:MAG: hypothetical protein Q9214_001138 [Letrouitia sp. 1 TL-2023]
MSVFLVHGFRWPRKNARIHIILNNIDDAAPEYMMARQSTEALNENFNKLFPQIMNNLPVLQFIEPYDPTDETSAALTQPYCFVSDLVERSEAYLDVTSVMNKGVKAAQWDALADLRDKLAPGEKIGWYVVHNGDEDRVKSMRDGKGEEDGSITGSSKKLSGMFKQLMKK